MRKETLKCVITFDSTSQAMKMEKFQKKIVLKEDLYHYPLSLVQDVDFLSVHQLKIQKKQKN